MNSANAWHANGPVEFRSSMQGVRKLPESDRYVHRPVYVAPNRDLRKGPVLSAEEETEAVLRESLSDEFDVEGMLDEDPALSYSRDGVGPDVVRKLRKRHWPIQDELDLHGMNRDAARDAARRLFAPRQPARRALRAHHPRRSATAPRVARRCCAASCTAGWCKRTK